MTPPRSRDAISTRLYTKLKVLYGDGQAPANYERLSTLLEFSNPVGITQGSQPLSLSEQDIMLITYGDHVRRNGETPLSTLHDTLQRLALPLNCLHILPFYPY